MLRDIRTMLDDAEDLLLPFLTDPALTSTEQATTRAAVDAVAAIKVNIPVDSIVPLELDRTATAASIRAQITACNPVADAHPEFPSYYNALNLWDDAATGLASGTASEDTTL